MWFSVVHGSNDTGMGKRSIKSPFSNFTLTKFIGLQVGVEASGDKPIQNVVLEGTLVIRSRTSSNLPLFETLKNNFP